MDYSAVFEEIIKTHNGYFRISDVEKKGIDRIYAYNWLKHTDLHKVAKGVFVTKQTFVDRMYVTSLRSKKAVFSYNSALFLNGLTDTMSGNIVVTVPQGYNFGHLTELGITAIQVTPKLLNIGKTYLMTPYGHQVPAYDKERTICDIVKYYEHFQIKDIQDILNRYDQMNPDYDKIMKYAEELKRQNKVIKFLEEFGK